MPYDDSYPACARTNAILKIISDDLHPDRVTEILSLSPTDFGIKGEYRKPETKKYQNRVNYWNFSSEGAVASNDCRRHIDWIISKILSQKEAVLEISRKGATIEVSCLWESKFNSGGPTLDPAQMLPLAELGISIWWEMWYPGQE